MRARSIAVLAVVAGLLAAAAPAAAAPRKGPWPADAVPGSLLVTAVDERTAASLAGPSFGRVAHVEVAPGTEAQAAAALRAVAGVLDVEPDRRLELLRTPNDAEFGGQYAHDVSDAEAAWDVTTGASTVRVALIDTGVDATHPDLQANVVTQIDLSSGTPRRVGPGVDNDVCDDGHGTLVAGVVGAVGDNGTGVAGVAWQVGLIDVAAADADCGFTESNVIAAIDQAVAAGADVVNMSLGGPGDTCLTAMQVAIDDARAAGAVVVAASGNEQEVLPGVTSVPASCNGVISVGATGPSGTRAPYSNSNRFVDVAAAGGLAGNGVLSTARGGGTAREAGTSFAAPYVAGVAALLLSVADLTPDLVEDHLEASTGRSTRTNELGWGVVNAGRAVASAEGGAEVPHRPDPVFPVGLAQRVSEGTTTTDPVRQAVAISSRVFEDGQALHVVIGRSDDFADSLAGSSLGFGTGPVLFTGRTGPLSTPTRAEVQRVLPRGGLVYLLGGTGALPPTLEGELTSLGYDVKRLAGQTREHTAAAVADEIPRRFAELGFPVPDRAILVTARNWPDAVTAGSLGAFFGYPILLTPPGALHPSTRWALGRLQPSSLYVVGGQAAVTDAVMRDAQVAAGNRPGRRLAGTDRFATAAAVAVETRSAIGSLLGDVELYVVAVNLRRQDAFTHVLSASPFPGRGGVYVGVEGEAGTSLPAASRDVACTTPAFLGVVAGGPDVVSDAVKQQFNTLLEDGC